jgi:hypothetical protein
MARKKIREYDSKRLLKAHILRLFNMQLPLNVAQVGSRLFRDCDQIALSCILIISFSVRLKAHLFIKTLSSFKLTALMKCSGQSSYV